MGMRDGQMSVLVIVDLLRYDNFVVCWFIVLWLDVELE